MRQFIVTVASFFVFKIYQLVFIVNDSKLIYVKSSADKYQEKMRIKR